MLKESTSSSLTAKSRGGAGDGQRTRSPRFAVAASGCPPGGNGTVDTSPVLPFAGRGICAAGSGGQGQGRIARADAVPDETDDRPDPGGFGRTPARAGRSTTHPLRRPGAQPPRIDAVGVAAAGTSGSVLQSRTAPGRECLVAVLLCSGDGRKNRRRMAAPVPLALARGSLQVGPRRRRPRAARQGPDTAYADEGDRPRLRWRDRTD